MTILVCSMAVGWCRRAIIMKPTIMPAAAPIAMPLRNLRFTCCVPSFDELLLSVSYVPIVLSW
jgi:hypothetical protein